MIVIYESENEQKWWKIEKFKNFKNYQKFIRNHLRDDINCVVSDKNDAERYHYYKKWENNETISNLT